MGVFGEAFPSLRYAPHHRQPKLTLVHQASRPYLAGSSSGMTKAPYRTYLNACDLDVGPVNIDLDSLGDSSELGTVLELPGCLELSCPITNLLYTNWGGPSNSHHHLTLCPYDRLRCYQVPACSNRSYQLLEAEHCHCIMDSLLFAGTGFISHLACAVVLALLGLGFHLSRRKSVFQSKEATATVDKHPWALQFPPSRRHTLASLKLKGSAGSYQDIPPEVLRRRAVPSACTADWDQDDLYTPTGFSTQDIRALGRFPDYSVLTGVRYPSPYGPQFDINKAVFRPFRPFRWSYHQTMGKPNHL